MESEPSTLHERLSDKRFILILILCLFASFVCIANAYTNQEIINVENAYYDGFTLQWFMVFFVTMAFVIAYPAYVCYTREQALTDNSTKSVFFALLFMIVAHAFWSFSLFHSRINRGAAGIAAVFLICAVIWFGVVCYRYWKASFYYFFIMLLWAFYLTIYTVNVDAHPWNPTIL